MIASNCKKNAILIVGAGFSGATVARILAEQDWDIYVIDKRDHVAGNAHDYINALGVRVHKYGPHLFHTSNDKVVKWLSRFCEWLPYQHKVKALLNDGRYVTLPVNLETRSIVGDDKILDTFFRPYTYKMWGMALENLNPGIISRVPMRDDMNELYFPNDTFQALPVNGYTNLVNKILEHPNIRIDLSTPYDKKYEKQFFHIFNSMPIDEYFSYIYGPLPYRSIIFHHFDLPVPRMLPVATVNFTHAEKYTRVTEWKILPGHGNPAGYTSITVEEPCAYEDNNYERYYPIKDIGGVNDNLYKKYRELIPENLTFIGRCGLYAYLDMHQAVSSSMAVAEKFLHQFLKKQ